jgi:hypothetical protein
MPFTASFENEGIHEAVRFNGRTLILHEDGEQFLRSLPPVTP